MTLPASDSDPAARTADPDGAIAAAATLGPSDIDRLAVLARLDFDGAERARLLDQLNQVFGVIEKLTAIDTRGVEPLTHPQSLALRERADAVTEQDRRDENQRPAPAVEAGLYLVPKVID